MIRVFHDMRDGIDGTPPGVGQLELAAEVDIDRFCNFEGRDVGLDGKAMISKTGQLRKAVELTQHPRGGVWYHYNDYVTAQPEAHRSTEFSDVLELDGVWYHYWYHKAGKSELKHASFVQLDKDYYASLLSYDKGYGSRLAGGTKKEPEGCGFLLDF